MASSSRSSRRNKSSEPTSPWRTLLVQSRSLEEASSSDENDESNNKSSHQRRRTSSNKTSSKQQQCGNMGSWGWLLTPPTRLAGNPLQRSSSPSSSKRHLLSPNRPSNLTMFLLRLHDHLPRYCALLSHGSLQDCKEAAKLLDLSVTTITSSPQHSPVSPNTFFSSPRLALEGEWETYISPLLLLTGAQALYGHVEWTNLTSLLQSISSDLKIVKQRLCDPWLASLPQRSETLRSTEHEAATSVALTLDGLQSYIAIQCQLMGMQTILFSETSIGFFSVTANKCLETCHTLLPSIKNGQYGATIQPMFTSLTKEIKAWTALLETCIFMEQCQFTDSILSARRLKQNLSPSSKTVLQHWFRSMLERLVSIMPMYFDRIQAFCSPLYGFDSLHSSSQYDAIMVDFLRKHESKGGPSMAICIVTDAVATSNLNFERGFVVQTKPSFESSSATQQFTPKELERKEWQAVYMRSTVHYNAIASPMSRSPSHGSGSISSIMRRSKGSSFRKSHNSRQSIGEDDFARSFASIMRPSSQETTSSGISSCMNVMEYPPATGPVSWPYAEWTVVVELIKEAPCQDDAVQAVTYRQPEPPKENVVSATPSLGLPPPPPKPATDSSFHLVRLSNVMTLVAIVKCEDDGKWHLRRTRGHSDEEIRVFLNEMALKLKVSILFDSIATAQKAFSDSNSSNKQSPDLVRAWQQGKSNNGFLRDLKRSFQLRPQSPFMENLRSRGGVMTPGRRKKRAVSYGESAMAFFVGSDLQLQWEQDQD